jgi:hypothetical protein
MENKQIEGTKHKKSWNPFQKLDGDAEILSAAKSGVVVSGFLGLSYVLQVAFVYWGGKDTFGNVGLSTLIADVIGIILAAFLTWRIWARQPLWAAVFVALWFSVEMVMKGAAIVSGQQKTNAGWIFMFAALAAAAILGVRGSWKLRQSRRLAKLSAN